MKNDLPYFSHDNDARNHPKMKALRAQYGIAGYGLFWMLNEMISQAEHARLDLSKKINRTAVAGELGMSLEQFESFLAFLSDPEYDLVNYKDGILMTDRTQEDYSRVKTDREAALVRKKRKKSGSSENIESSPELCEGSPEPNKRAEQSREEEKREEQQPRARDLSTSEVEEAALFDFALKRVLAKKKKPRDPEAMARSIMHEKDVLDDFRAPTSAPPGDQTTKIAPEPEKPCACGGKIKTNGHLGEGICTECGAGYAYNWDFDTWQPEKVAVDTS